MYNSSSTCSLYTLPVSRVSWGWAGGYLIHRDAAYNYYAASYWPNLPNFGSCAGTESAAVFGCLLLSSYLVLFINFYIQTYKKPVKGKGKAVANGKANGVANGYVLQQQS